MGTRLTDPNGKGQTFFSPSDTKKGYPAFMRVLIIYKIKIQINPILYWNQTQIWNFIK